MSLPKSSHGPGRFRKSRGFTMLELIATIIILGVLSSLAVNMMRDYRLRQNVDAARQMYANGITAALAESAKSNSNYTICVFEKKVLVFPGSACSDKILSDYKASPAGAHVAYVADLTAFANPRIFYTDLGDGDGDGDGDCTPVAELTVTPFGKINPKDTDHIATSEKNRAGSISIYFSDAEGNVVNKQNLCIGVQVNKNGTTVLIDKSTNGTSCAPEI